VAVPSVGARSSSSPHDEWPSEQFDGRSAGTNTMQIDGMQAGLRFADALSALDRALEAANATVHQPYTVATQRQRNYNSRDRKLRRDHLKLDQVV